MHTLIGFCFGVRLSFPFVLVGLYIPVGEVDHSELWLSHTYGVFCEVGTLHGCYFSLLLLVDLPPPPVAIEIAKSQAQTAMPQISTCLKVDPAEPYAQNAGTGILACQCYIAL